MGLSPAWSKRPRAFAGSVPGSALLGLSVLALLVTSCSLVDYPTQSNPSCSWVTTPPSDADTLCRAVYRTVDAVARAEVRGDAHTVRRLVTSGEAAARILAYGGTLRAARVRGFHVVPSMTLDGSEPGTVRASLFILGRPPSGRLRATETLYLRVHHGAALIVRDVPGQEW